MTSLYGAGACGVQYRTAPDCAQLVPVCTLLPSKAADGATHHLMMQPVSRGCCTRRAEAVVADSAGLAKSRETIQLKCGDHVVPAQSVHAEFTHSAPRVRSTLV